MFAAGDVARWFDEARGEHIRLEHAPTPSTRRGCVAHNITHPEVIRTYSPVEYVGSDQSDGKLQIAHRPAAATRHTVLGNLDDDAARAALLYGDDRERLLGTITVNWPRAQVECRRLPTQGTALGAAATRTGVNS